MHSYLPLRGLTGRKGTATLLALLVALCTEIAQLYFGRDGRMADVLIDGFGMLLAHLLRRWIHRRVRGREGASDSGNNEWPERVV